MNKLLLYCLLFSSVSVLAMKRNKEKKLIEAAKQDKIEHVKELIDKGACGKEANSDNMTALHYLAGHGHNDLMDLLISRGADINAKGENGAAPLLIAVMNNKSETVAFLLEKKADPNVKVKNGETNWMTLLQAAILHNLEAIVALLIDHQANINAPEVKGWTALHLAASLGYEGITKRLLEKKADVSLISEDQQTPLLLAQQAGHTAIVRLLRIHQGKEVRSCLGCGSTERLKRCAGCKKVSFCGVDCQKKVWRVHKSTCTRTDKIEAVKKTST